MHEKILTNNDNVHRRFTAYQSELNSVQTRKRQTIKANPLRPAHPMFKEYLVGIRLMYGMGKGKSQIGFYIAASNCIISNNHIEQAYTGILNGDGKNADWTGKFDTTRYPSRVMQDIAPFDNILHDNVFLHCNHDVVSRNNPNY